MSPAATLQGTRQVEITQDDFSTGVVRDVAPHLIDDTGLYDLVNGILMPDGSAQERGGTSYKSNAAFGAAGLTWLADVYLRGGQRTVFANPSDFGVLDSDDTTPVNLGQAGLTMPKSYAVIQDLMFIGGGHIYGGSRMSANYTTGTVSVTQGSKTVTGSGTTWSTLVDAGMLFQRGNERVYLVESVDSTTQITLRDAYEGVTGAAISYTLYPIYPISAADPYEASDYYTSAGGRLLWLSGVNNSQVKFTALNVTTGTPNPHTFTATDYHDLPRGVAGLGLASLDQTVLVFTTAGVWTLNGITFDIVDEKANPQHQFRQLSNDLVLLGDTGITGYQRRLIVPAIDGVYLMDGVSAPQKISRPIENLLVGSYAKLGYRTGQAEVVRGHYLLPIIDSSADVKDTLVCRVDRPIRARAVTVFPWSRFTGEIISYAVRTLTGSRTPLLLGAQSRNTSKIENCNGYFDPTTATKYDADGSQHNIDLITRDFETGEGIPNSVRSLKVDYVLVDAATDNPILQASWSDGATATGGARWDEVDWDEFLWGDEGGVEYNSLGCTLAEQDGRTRRKCAVNKTRPRIRFRLRGIGPAAFCTIRGVTLSIRPSGAVRR